MIRISDPNSTAFVSDWIELYVAVTGEFISKTKLSQVLERDTGEEPKESFICDVWTELDPKQACSLRLPCSGGDDFAGTHHPCTSRLAG